MARRKRNIKKPKKWIQAIGMEKGALSRQLGVPEEKNIPVSTLRKAAKKSGTLGKRARLALTLKKLGRRKKRQ